MQKKRNGMAVIMDSIDVFENIVIKLEEGITLCSEEADVIRAEIAGKETKLGSINKIMLKAQNVKRNIHQILK